ncbi:MAG: glycosyltransferase [Lachnospiraceae bacterium]|nr:glycosyltransferase [Lachnospiraceae bacterium]
MNANQIYKDYFSKKKEVITYMIDTLCAQKKKVVVWGGGARGTAFLQVFDKENKKILGVYDRNEERYGTCMPTGHIIMDYKEDEADVVFVMNNIYEIDVKERMTQQGSKATVINIDNIILGDYEKDTVFAIPKVDLERVRDIRAAAVVILYEPNEVVYDNILTYASDVEIIYVYDNSEQINEKIKKRIMEIPNVHYIANAINEGLPRAINIVADMAMKKGIEWLFTFDQDSQADKGMVAGMIRFAESRMCGEKIGMIAPNITRESGIQYDCYYTYYDKVIQSGAMHRLSILKELGGYDEALFIDQVDYDYCTRMRLAGYYLIKVNQFFLRHNLQDDENVIEKFINGKKYFENKYSPARYYYICRNNRYCMDKYEKKDAVYALECYNNITYMEQNVEYDNQKEEKLAAMRQAEIDYINGKMGKWEGCREEKESAVLEKVILFGTGTGAKKVIRSMNNDAEILAFADNDLEKVGQMFHGKPVILPQDIHKFDYDKIVICSIAYDAIKKQLEEMGDVDTKKIVKNLYFHQQRLLRYYENENNKVNKDMLPYIDYIKQNGLDTFNASFKDKYLQSVIEVFRDEDLGLYYTFYCGKKMYLSAAFDSEEKVRQYVRSIMIEQDVESPHRYFTDSFYVSDGDVVLDAGVAEGNFALEIIDKVKKIYLVEADPLWVYALQHTFAPYQEKVQIIQAFLTENQGDNSTTVDAVLGNQDIDFIKMDIEGDEIKALHGAAKTLERKVNLKLDICAYHNEGDEMAIRQYLEKKGFRCSVSDGYMIFRILEDYDKPDTKKLVRGLVRAEKHIG